METVSYEDLVAAGGWAKAQAAGKLRIEGKEYLIQDGDVIHVRFRSEPLNSYVKML